MVSLILDTNIILYLRNPVEKDKRVKKAVKILNSIIDGLHEGIITSPVLMEAYAIASYSDDEEFAKEFIKNILETNNIKTMVIDREMAEFAGQLYLKYNVIPKRKSPPEKDCPSACDCLIASVNKYHSDSIVCTNDFKMQQIDEINSDFFGIQTI